MKIIHSNKLLSFFLLLSLLLPVSAMAADRVYLDISSSDVRKIQFAIPWFVNKKTGVADNKIGAELADTLAKALKFHGIISIVPTSSYGGSQNSNWSNVGADFVVLGNFVGGSKELKLELRLLDVTENSVMMGKAYSGTIRQQEKIIFKFCDEVIKELTGIPGIASTQIAFVSHEGNAKEVFLTDILGRSLRQVTRHRNLVVSPRFTPDGKALTYTSFHSGNPNLYMTELNQSKVTRALSRRKGMNTAPAWSPDGKKLILTLSVDGNPDLYMLDNRGRILDRLTKNSGINVSPTWSPDGKKIAFASDRSSRGRTQIYVMDLDTRKTRRITYNGKDNAEPKWSPAEDLLVYYGLQDGVYQLFTIRPEAGAEPTQITTDLSHHESPSWSPDGNQIIFAKRDGKKHQIYAIMKNGSFQRRVLSFPGSHTYPQWSN